MLNHFRRFLLRHPRIYAVWAVALELIGRVCFDWLDPLVTGDDMIRAMQVLQPGDIIGVRSRRYLTSYLIPGKYKHTAVYLGHRNVIHAAAPHVTKLPLDMFLNHYDGFIILRPNQPYNWKAADRWAFTHINKGYDFRFADDNEALYCHELGAMFLMAGGQDVKRAGDSWLFDDLRQCCSVVMEV